MRTDSNNEPLTQQKNETNSSQNVSTHFKGWLKNGNPPGDLRQAPRCHARSKRTGQPCQQPAMANGCCRLHGGKSTGPRTSEGLARSRRANWKHGDYSQAVKEELKAFREEFREMMKVLKLAQQGSMTAYECDPLPPIKSLQAE